MNDWKKRRNVLLVSSLINGLLWGTGIFFLTQMSIVWGIVIFVVVTLITMFAMAICAAGSDADDAINQQK